MRPNANRSCVFSRVLVKCAVHTEGVGGQSGKVFSCWSWNCCESNFLEPPFKPTGGQCFPNFSVKSSLKYTLNSSVVLPGGICNMRRFLGVFFFFFFLFWKQSDRSERDFSTLSSWWSIWAVEQSVQPAVFLLVCYGAIQKPWRITHCMHFHNIRM